MLCWRLSGVAMLLVVGCGDASTTADPDLPAAAATTTSSTGGGAATTTTTSGSNGGSTTMAATTTGMGGGPSCIDLPTVPGGWDAVFLGLGHDVGCDSDDGADRLANLRNVQPWTCGCDCGTDCEAVVEFDTVQSCTTGVNQALADGACVAAPAPYARRLYSQGGDCVEQPTAAPPVQAYETDPITLCDIPAEPRECLPIPTGYLPMLCIRGSGGGDCPPGFEGWEEETCLSVNASRGCTECTCDDPLNGGCDLSGVTVHNSAGCDDGPTGAIPLSCTFVDGSHVLASFQHGCLAEGGEPTGGVTKVDKERLCCTHEPPPGTFGD